MSNPRRSNLGFRCIIYQLPSSVQHDSTTAKSESSVDNLVADTFQQPVEPSVAVENVTQPAELATPQPAESPIKVSQPAEQLTIPKAEENTAEEFPVSTKPEIKTAAKAESSVDNSAKQDTPQRKQSNKLFLCEIIATIVLVGVLIKHYSAIIFFFRKKFTSTSTLPNELSKINHQRLSYRYVWGTIAVVILCGILYTFFYTHIYIKKLPVNQEEFKQKLKTIEVQKDKK